MTPEQVKILIEMLVERLERESPLLTPIPSIYIRDPYGIFDWLVKEDITTAKALDECMQKFNTKRGLGRMVSVVE